MLSLLLGICLGVELLELRWYCFMFEDLPICLPQVAHHPRFPPVYVPFAPFGSTCWKLLSGSCQLRDFSPSGRDCMVKWLHLWWQASQWWEHVTSQPTTASADPRVEWGWGISTFQRHTCWWLDSSCSPHSFQNSTGGCGDVSEGVNVKTWVWIPSTCVKTGWSIRGEK